MGFFDSLGLGDVFADLADIGKELDGLKQDIIDSVVEPVKEVSSTVTDTSQKLQNDVGSISNSLNSVTSSSPTIDE